MAEKTGIVGWLSGRLDGWQSVVLGIGGARDPSAGTTFGRRAKIPDDTLEAMYIEDHFAARIIEALVREGLRPGWSMRAGGNPAEAAEIRDAYSTAEDELDVVWHLRFGSFWARTFGGAVTWMGVEDGLGQSEPMAEDRIKTVQFLRTYDRRDVDIHSYYTERLDPRRGQPRTYKVRPVSAVPALGAGTIIHESRLVVWPGQPTTASRKLLLIGWDDSVLERCWDALKQVGEDYAGKSLLLGRISQAVYKIKDLYKMIAGKQEEMLRKRIALMDISRSRARAVVLDIDEDLANVTQPIAGLADVISSSTLRVAACAVMPVTVLMGQSPAGMNATGESDLTLWYGEVDGWRDQDLRPGHRRIAKVIMLARDGPTKGVLPDTWSIAYGALRTLTRAQRADVQKTESETDSNRIERGLASPEAIAIHRFGLAAAEGDLTLDLDELKEALERRKDLDKQPPKDNAELGTVGARTTAVLEVVTNVIEEVTSRETGLAILVKLHRYTEEDAEELLGPEDFEAKREEPDVDVDVELDPEPGASPPVPPVGMGAGAPQDGRLNEGGDPRKETQ